MTWHQDMNIPDGHRMSMKDALYLVSKGTAAKVMLPNWSLKLTKHLRSIKIAYEELQVQRLHSFTKGLFNMNVIFLKMYMSEMIRERKNSEKVERHDLFSNLLAANDEDMDIVNLTENELMGVSLISK